MTELFEKLCKKHSLNENAKLDFKNLFEKEIIQVFNKKANEINKETIINKITKSKNTNSNSDNLCIGKKADGKPCSFKAKKDSEYCGRHNPDKSTQKTVAKPRVKKSSLECHAVIAKTGKKCIQPATTKPEGSDFYYCKRHSEKWTEFEQEHIGEEESVKESVKEEEESLKEDESVKEEEDDESIYEEI